MEGEPAQVEGFPTVQTKMIARRGSTSERTKVPLSFPKTKRTAFLLDEKTTDDERKRGGTCGNFHNKNRRGSAPNLDAPGFSPFSIARTKPTRLFLHSILAPSSIFTSDRGEPLSSRGRRGAR
jgi:hypothetical protein